MIAFRGTAAVALAAALAAGCGKRDGTASGSKAGAPPGPAPGFARFVNSPDGLTGQPAAHYADFWFDYPSDCQMLRQGPEMPNNFVRINRLGQDGEIVEQFNVGWFSVDRPDLDLWAGVEQVAGEAKSSATAGCRGVEVLAEGRAKVAGYDAYEFKFRHSVPRPGHERTEAWMVGPNGERLPPPAHLQAMLGTHEARTLGFAIVPQPNGPRRDGVVLITLVRGEGGALAAVANSFRFGKP